VRVVTEGDERRHVVVGNQPHGATVTTITPVRSAVHHRTLATKTHAASAAVAASNIELCFVDKPAHVYELLVTTSANVGLLTLQAKTLSVSLWRDFTRRIVGLDHAWSHR
jgi:hypothetical protein